MKGLDFIKVVYSEKTPKQFKALKSLRPMLVEMRETIEDSCADDVAMVYSLLTDERVYEAEFPASASLDEIVFFLKEKRFSDQQIFVLFANYFGEGATLRAFKHMRNTMFQHAHGVTYFCRYN